MTSSKETMLIIHQQKNVATSQEREASGNKRIHESKSSDSEKEIFVNIEETQLAIVSSTPSFDSWWKVEKMNGIKV